MELMSGGLEKEREREIVRKRRPNIGVKSRSLN